MGYEMILYEVADGVATITLNRPDTLNAFNDQMIGETTAAFKAAGRDKTVRVIVITGNGRAFSSGQDLADVQARGDDFSIGDHLRHGYHRLLKQMMTVEKPVIAAVNGVTAGAGVGITLAADIRIASEKASFILAFSKIGLVPDSGTNWFLPRIIGQGRAYELAITGDRLSANKALEWGMVNAVTAPENLAETVATWATRFASGATLAFGLTKRAMNRSWELSLGDALDYEAHLQEVANRSEDYKEGVDAFLEKRPAVFKGK